MLLLGSGGLSIGQAGEFDYSVCSFPLRRFHPKLACLLHSTGLASDQSAERGADRSGAGEPQHRDCADVARHGRQNLLPPGAPPILSATSDFAIASEQVTPEFVTQVIEKERPDGILLQCVSLSLSVACSLTEGLFAADLAVRLRSTAVCGSMNRVCSPNTT